MRKIIWMSILFSTSFCLAKVAPQEMKEFNKLCPTPLLCQTMYENLQQCEKGQKKECSLFIDNYKKALPEYDCQRSFDSTAKEKYIVPAIWLCETHEYFLNSLSKMKSLKAQRLYGSPELREVLDDYLAEEHRKKSIRVGQRLRKKADK